MRKQLVLVLLLLSALSIFAQTSGGPDAFGYSWINSNDANGPVFSWINPDTTNAAQITSFSDDSVEGPFPIGFNFSFYDSTFTDFYISSNGFITFSDQGSNLTNGAIPAASSPNGVIAWFWNDMDPVSTSDSTHNARVYYENITYDGANALLITLMNYHSYPGEGDGYVDAQVILSESGLIIMQYDTFGGAIALNSSTIGIENFDGTTGLQYCYNDATLLSDQLAIKYLTVEAGYPEFAQNPNPASGTIGVLVDGTLTWDFGADTETYDLWFGEAGNMTQVVTGAAAGATGSYSYNGLNTLTTYEWRVDTHNSATRLSTTGAVWIFETQCGTITTFPWNEDFEGAQLPSCWLDDAANISPWSYGTATSSTNTGPQSGDHTSGTGYFMYTEASGNTSQVFKVTSPIFDATSLSSPVLEFWYHMYGQSMGTLQVNIYEPATATLHADVVTPISGDQGDVWNNASVDLSSYTGEFQIEFIGTTGDNYYSDICIDDVGIYDNVAVPACNALNTPVDAAVDILENGTLTWAGAQGATGYKVSFGTDNPPTNIEDGFDAGAAFSYAYSGLTFGTTYYWMVTPYNAVGDASGCPVQSFTVRADPTVTTFPWTEDFNAWPPQNWTFSGTRLWAEDSGSGSAYCNFWGWSDGDAHMTSPPISLPAAGSFSFGFNWSHLYSTSYPNDSAAVYVSTDGINWNMEWTLGGTNFDSNDGAANTAPGTFTYNEFTLDSYLGQTIYIDVVGYSGYGPNFYVDNATVFSVSTPPGCTVVDTPADAATDIVEMGTLRWNTTGGTTGYKLFLGSDNPPTNIENGTDLGNVQTYDFSGLTFNTTYYWTVVPYNVNGDATGCPVWSFTTRPDPTISNFPWTEDFSSFPLEPRGWNYGGTQQWAEYSDSSSTSIFCNFWGWSEPNNAELYSPPIALSGNADLLFKWSHHFSTSYPNDALEVSVSTDQTNWNVIWSIQDSLFESNDGAGNTVPGTFVQETVNIDAYSGQTIYLKFDGISGYGPNLYIDDVGINITTPPDDDLTVITVFGDTTPMVGSPSDYTISVRNNGLNSQSTYDVKLILAPDTEIGTVPGTAISTDQINDYVITWTPQNGMEDLQNIFGRVVLANDENPANDDSATLPVNVQASQTGIQGYVRDINGNPLVNAQVLIEETQVVQQTGANGFYQFLNVAPGTYTCTATLTNYDDNTQNSVVVVQDALTNVDFTMTQGAILHGIVYDQDNNVVAGATVEIPELTLTTVTDDQGAYSFVQLTPGTYTVNGTKDGYIDVTEANVVVAADATVNLDLVLNEYGHLTVNITTNLNSPAGAVVELTDGTNTYTETSDDTGVVLLNEVLPGTYSLTASLVDCNTHEQANIVIVNGDNTPIDVTLNEELIAPTNVTWHSDQGGYLSWSHGDRLFDTRGNNDDVLAGGQGYNDKNSQNGNDERQLINFRVEIDLFNQTTQDTFLTVTGFEDNEALTAIVTAVYETGTASAPAYDFNFVVGNDDEDNASLITELKGNYPNPFNPTTNIEFSLKKSGNVELVIYNITGQKVRTLVSGDMEADTHRITWNGKDDRGNTVSSGTYFYRLQTSEYTKTRKMLMLK